MPIQNFISLDNGKYKETYPIQASLGVSDAGKIPALDSSGLLSLTMISQSSATLSGYLSSTDWNTFNNKQNALSGTINYIPKYTGVSTLSSTSLLYDNGSQVIVNGTAAKLISINGTGSAATNITPQLNIVGSSTSVGVGAYVNDGTNFRRVGLFTNGTDGLFGVSGTYAAGGHIDFTVQEAYNRLFTIFGATGNMIITYGGAANHIDNGYRLTVVGSFKATSNVVLSGIANATTSNVLYYDSGTGAVTYGASGGSGGGGTVTSVALSMPSAFSVSGSPITTSGTFTITGAGTSSQYIDGTGALQTFPSLTGYVPYTGATNDVDLGTFMLNAAAMHIKGVGGNGHLGLKHQSAAATGSASESLIYANSSGNLAWQNDNLYSFILANNAFTANRSFTLPDASGTIALTSNIGTWGALNYPTWTSGTPFVKMTAAGTFALDTNTYITGNQSIAFTATGDVTGSSSGTTTLTPTLTIQSNYKATSFGVTLDGQGGVVSLGQKGYFKIPYSGTITSWTIISSVSGSCVFDVWKTTGSLPTVSNSITGSAKPTLTSNTIANSSTLTGWTTTVTAGDIIGFNLDSVTSCLWVTLEINITKTQ